jgi:hypothetical protein
MPFDPNQPYEVVDQSTSKVQFDPSQPFEVISEKGGEQDNEDQKPNQSEANSYSNEGREANEQVTPVGSKANIQANVPMRTKDQGQRGGNDQTSLTNEGQTENAQGGIQGTQAGQVLGSQVPAGNQEEVATGSVPPAPEKSFAQKSFEATRDFGAEALSSIGQNIYGALGGLARTEPEYIELPSYGTKVKNPRYQESKDLVDFFERQKVGAADVEALGATPLTGVAKTAADVTGGLLKLPAQAFTGPLGMASMIGEAFGSHKDAVYQKAKSEGLSDEEALSKANFEATASTAAALPLYYVGGKVAGAAADKILSESAPKLVNVATRVGLNAVANSVASAASRGVTAALAGENIVDAMKDVDVPSVIQDIAFAAHSTATHFQEQVAKGNGKEAARDLPDHALEKFAQDANYAEVVAPEVKARAESRMAQQAEQTNLPETAKVLEISSEAERITTPEPPRFEEAPAKPITLEPITPEAPPLAQGEAAPSLQKEETQPPVSVAGEATVAEPTAKSPVNPIESFKSNLEESGLKYLKPFDFKKEGKIEDWEKEGGIIHAESYYPTTRIGNTSIGFSTEGMALNRAGTGVLKMIDADFDKNGNKIFSIEAIKTDPEKRGTGDASKALKQITDIADNSGLTIQLEPTPIKDFIKSREKKLSKQQLVEWYKKNGFVQKYEGNDTILIREPKPAEATAEAQPTILSETKIKKTSGLPTLESVAPVAETAVKAEEGVAQREGEGKEEVVVPEGARVASAAYLAEDGKVYEGSSHLNAMQAARDTPRATSEETKAWQDKMDAEIASKQDPESRNTSEFGFNVIMPDGTEQTTTREFTSKIIKQSGQVLSDKFVYGEKVHSNETTKDKYTKSGEPINRPIDDDTRSFLSELAESSKKELGRPGAASTQEYMDRYSNIGASIIARGVYDYPTFAREFEKEAGSSMRDQLPEIFEASKERINNFQTASAMPKKPVQPKEVQSINPSVALKQYLRAQEKAGEAGYKRGIKELRPVISDLKSQIAESLTKAQGFSEYLRGMEKGSKIGAEAKTKELTQKYRIADKALAGDQENIRGQVVDFLKATLPPEERGRFVGAVSRLLSRPSIISGDPIAWYKKAGKVMGKIEARANEVHKNNLIESIKTNFDKALSSQKVDVDYKNIIKGLLSDVQFKKPSSLTVKDLESRRAFVNKMKAAGEKIDVPAEAIDELEKLTKTPIKQLPVDALEALNDNIELYTRLGKTKFKSKQELWNYKKNDLLNEVKSAKVNKPMNERPKVFSDPDTIENKKAIIASANAISKTQNALGDLDIGVLPTDAAQELIDNGSGTYNGFNVKRVKGQIDLNYNNFINDINQNTRYIYDVAKKNNVKLAGNQMGKIAIYANLQMEGGRERMIDSGSASELAIKRVETSGLTSAEMNVYKAMMKTKQDIYEKSKRVLKDIYNVDIKDVENHWPWQMDWEKAQEVRKFAPSKDPITGEEYDPNQIIDAFLMSYQTPQRTTKAEKGFSIERKKGAKTPVLLDAWQNWDTAIRQMLYIHHMQPNLKMLGEVIRSDDYANKYGSIAQKYQLDFLDTIARRGTSIHKQGAIENLANEVRKNLSTGIIALRPASQLKHLGFLPYAQYHSGGSFWYLMGLRAAHTKEGAEFLKTHFAEIGERAGSDVGLQELQEGTGTWSTIRRNAANLMFTLVRSIDHENSSATALGRYFYSLNKQGLDWSKFNEMPARMDSVQEARLRMRRAVASPLYKDVPLILTRGYGFKGSSTAAKSLFQFGNPKLDQWSNVRVDLLGAIRSGDYGRAAGLGSAIALGSAIETGVKLGTGAALAMAGGGLYQLYYGKKKQEKKKEPITTQAKDEFIKDIITKIPLTSNVWQMIEYKESGIPLVDYTVQTMYDIGKLLKPTTPERFKENLIKTTGEILTLSGIPASQTVADAAKAIFVDEGKKKAQADIAKAKTRLEKMAKKIQE